MSNLLELVGVYRQLYVGASENGHRQRRVSRLATRVTKGARAVFSQYGSGHLG